MTQRAARSGFTLIELMVVVVIIAALAGMVLPRVLPASDAAKRNIAMGDIANITVAVKLYRLHHDVYPSSLDDLLRPSSAAGWNEPYLEKRAVDPWNRPYEYKYPGVHNRHGFDLWSRGPDGQSGSADDVTNWGN